ncbi:MAG: hypothetical protein IJU95_09260 [Treponema sp.]|nr:hypothetical protein [Treponema sp.]
MQTDGVDAGGFPQRVRLEIIFSQALEEDFQLAFKEEGIGKRFTKFQSVMGAGTSDPKLGDAVWPQLNMMYVIYCDKAEAKKIYAVVRKLRKKFLTEGIACFMSRATEM